MKIYGLMTVKDEEDILPKMLDENSKWLDGIIAIDNGSTDNSYKILSNHSLVKYHEIDNHEFDDSFFIQKLLDIVSNYNDIDWLVDIDADEIYDLRIRDVLESLPRMWNCISVDIQYMFNDVCYRENKKFTRIFRNRPVLFEFGHIKKLHAGKNPIPTKYRITHHSGIKVAHYQIRSYEQGIEKYNRYLELDPNRIYQKSYEHLKEVAKKYKN